jgi:hypothetical protein
MEKQLRTLISQLVKEELSLFEKKLKKDEESAEETELNLDIPMDEPVAMDAPAAPEMDLSGGDSTEKQVGQGLQMALDAAKKMPDSETKEKLVRQIGNTALFFLKTQIPGDKGQM